MPALLRMLTCVELLAYVLQALIRKYMPIAVILGTVLLLWLVKKFFFSLVG